MITTDAARLGSEVAVALPSTPRDNLLRRRQHGFFFFFTMDTRVALWVMEEKSLSLVLHYMDDIGHTL